MAIHQSLSSIEVTILQNGVPLAETQGVRSANPAANEVIKYVGVSEGNFVIEIKVLPVNQRIPEAVVKCVIDQRPVEGATLLQPHLQPGTTIRISGEHVSEGDSFFRKPFRFTPLQSVSKEDEERDDDMNLAKRLGDIQVQVCRVEGLKESKGLTLASPEAAQSADVSDDSQVVLDEVALKGTQTRYRVLYDPPVPMRKSSVWTVRKVIDEDDAPWLLYTFVYMQKEPEKGAAQIGNVNDKVIIDLTDD